MDQERQTEDGWVETYTGRKFYPLKPDKYEISILDIAHSLSMQCRYQGMCHNFYSVAQHSVMVSKLFEKSAVGTYRLEMLGLLHDASEAYLSDIPRPLKHLPEFAVYREAEDRLQTEIFKAFGLTPVASFEADLLKSADLGMLLSEIATPEIMFPTREDWFHKPTETLTTKNGSPFECWPPQKAKNRFLKRFNEIQAKM